MVAPALICDPPSTLGLLASGARTWLYAPPSSGPLSAPHDGKSSLLLLLLFFLFVLRKAQCPIDLMVRHHGSFEAPRGLMTQPMRAPG